MVPRAGLAILGVYVCLLGAVVHRQVWRAADVTWPWGLIAVVVVTGLVTIAAGRALTLGGAWLALGWAVGLLALQWSPGGGYLVNHSNSVYLFGRKGEPIALLPVDQGPDAVAAEIARWTD